MGLQGLVEDKYGTEAENPARRVGRAAPGGVRRPSVDRDREEGLVPRKTRRAGFGSGFRLTFRPGIVPRSKRGRIVAGVAVLVGLGMVAGVAYAGQRFLLRDERFVIPSSASIEIEGNQHLTRAQLLSVFGEDVERNIFAVSLGERRAELQQLPWVEHATVMRLMPNRMRVAIVERTPVAFVRQGSRIGLVDTHGVLLDMAGDDGDESGSGSGRGEKYSFPVVTGISDSEPLSVRDARMKIYQRFTAELDSSKENISGRLSEVDLSNPEDVKALIPESGTEILVHFGETDFLARYRKFEAQMPGWRTQYPKLASADMRYERQVVLEMQPGASVAANVAAPDAGKADVKPEKAVPAKTHTAGPVKTAHKVRAKSVSGFGHPHFPDDVAGAKR